MHPLETALREGRFPVALEITPPRTSRPELLARRASALPRAAAIHLIERPDRVSSLDAARMLGALGVPTVWHLANRGRSRAELRRLLARAAIARIEAVLCMRGDHTASDRDDTPSLRALVGMVRTALPAAFVGATFNQYGSGASATRALENLRGKLDAGARFIVTQPAFEPMRIVAARRTLERDAFWLPTLMPVLSLEGALAIEKRLRVPLPAALLRDLRRGEDEAGWRFFADTLSALRPVVDGCAIVTPVADPSRVDMARIAALLESS